MLLSMAWQLYAEAVLGRRFTYTQARNGSKAAYARSLGIKSGRSWTAHAIAEQYFRTGVDVCSSSSSYR